MSTDLHSIISDIFRPSLHTYRGLIQAQYSDRELTGVNRGVSFMSVPIDKDIFEVPAFAMNTFLNIQQNNRDFHQIASLAIPLYTNREIPYYKTVGRYMRDVLNSSYDRGLIILKPNDKGIPSLYYGTKGAIFDCNFNPIAMFTLQVKKEGESFTVIKPILRVNPLLYIYKETDIDKFIANKLIPACVSDLYYLRNINRIQVENQDKMGISVIMEKMPFDIRRVPAPDASFEQHNLIELALNHLDEILQ